MDLPPPHCAATPSLSSSSYCASLGLCKNVLSLLNGSRMYVFRNDHLTLDIQLVCFFGEDLLSCSNLF